MLGAPSPRASTQEVRLAVRASLRRGKNPPPGAQHGAYHWRDLLDGQPPRRRERGGGTYVLYHGTEHGDDVRVSYTTVVHVDPGDDPDSPLDDLISVDERLSIQRRPLQELLDREREFSDALAVRARSRLTQSLVRQRRVAHHLPGILLAFGLWLIHVEARVGFALITTRRAVMRGVVDVPDTIITRSVSAASHLSTRLGRRRLWRALQDPRKASPNEKGIVLLLVTAVLVGAVLLSSMLFSLVFAGGAVTYRHVMTDASASLVSTLAAPLPLEPILLASVLALGPFLGVLGLFLGKMVGSWILYLLGDALFDVVEEKTRGRPRLKRFIHRMQAGADRTGFAWLVAINAIPLVPDLLVYAFAVSGMRYRSFMGGVAVGTLLKFGAIAAAIALVGPERLSEFFHDPLGTLRGA